jgi:hypothetical protein
VVGAKGPSRRFLGLLLMIIFYVSSSSAQTTFTTNGSGTVWTSAANWTCGGCGLYPGQSTLNDIVIINNSVNLTSTLARSVGSVTVNNAVLQVSGNITLTALSVAVNSSGTSTADFSIFGTASGSPTVNITNDLTITRGSASTAGSNANTRLRVGGSGSNITNSIVTIGGNLYYTYNNSSSITPENATEISIGNSASFADNCIVSITGDVLLTYNYANTAATSNDLAFNVAKASSVSMNNLKLQMLEGGSGAGGANIRVATLSNLNATITVNGDATMEWNDNTSPSSSTETYIKAGNDDPASLTSIIIKGNLNMNSLYSTGSNNNMVRVSGSSILTLGGNVNGGNLNFNSSLSSPVDNRITLYDNGVFNLYGSIVNTAHGSFEFEPTGSVSDNGTIKFLGSSAQNFPTNFSGASNHYKNIVINNTSNIAFTIPNSTLNVEGLLTLTNGIINSTTSNVLVFEDGATCNGGSYTSYVTGLVQKKGGTLNNNLIFPVGSGSHWAPIQVSSITGANSTTIFNAQYFSSKYSTVIADGTFDHPSGTEYWDLTVSGTAPTSSVTLFWKDACFSKIYDVSTGPSQDLLVCRFNSGTSTWNKLSSTVDGGSGAGIEGCPSSTISGSVTASAVSLFGSFTFGAISSSQNPLPITVSKFDATRFENDFIKLEWTTNSEINNDYFVLMHSLNGLSFFPTDTVRGAGTSEDYNYYESIDHQPVEGTNYYRLVSVDYDGTVYYNATISIKILNIESDHLIQVFPNPVKNSLITVILRSNIIAKEEKSSLFQLYSSSGINMTDHCKFTNINSREIQIQLNQVTAGLYFLIFKSDSGFRPIKIIVE